MYRCTLCILSKVSFSDLILCRETCLGSFGSSDVSRSSLVFLKKEILTPKLLRIYGGLLILAVAIFFKETRGSVLLSRRAKLLNSWYEAREKVGLVGMEIIVDGKGTKECQRIRWKVKADEERETLAKMIGISVYRPFRRLYLWYHQVMKLKSYRFAIDRARCLLLFPLGFIQLGHTVPDFLGNTARVHQESSF